MRIAKLFSLLFEGFYSWRNQDTGSIFIQTVCEVLSAYTGKANKDDQQLTELLTKVNHNVAYEYKSRTTDREYNGCKLMPVLTIKLRKLITIPHRCPKSELPHPGEPQSDLIFAIQQMRVNENPDEESISRPKGCMQS